MDKKCTTNHSMPHTDEEAELRPIGKVFGNDNRRLVTDTTRAPYNAIVRLIIIINGVEYYGTGFMIKRGIMLTAGHNIYDHSSKKYCDVVYAVGKDGICYRVRDTVIPPEFKTCRTAAYDWAVAKLETVPGVKVPCLNYINMDGVAEPDVVNKNAELAGYPIVVRDVTTKDMYMEMGDITSYNKTDKLLSYTIDTSGGNSGSPVIVYIDTVPYAIGIHVKSGESCNIARAIDDDIIRAIRTL